jgi:hypothetical protein
MEAPPASLFIKIAWNLLLRSVTVIYQHFNQHLCTLASLNTLIPRLLSSKVQAIAPP